MYTYTLREYIKYVATIRNEIKQELSPSLIAVSGTPCPNNPKIRVIRKRK